jgi:hypothetical protein
LVSPVTVIGLAVPWAVMLPGLDVTVYPVMALPPFEAGAVKLTVVCALPAVAVTFVGAPGTAAGLTWFEGLDAAPVPTELVAVTVNV